MGDESVPPIRAMAPVRSMEEAARLSPYGKAVATVVTRGKDGQMVRGELIYEPGKDIVIHTPGQYAGERRRKATTAEIERCMRWKPW